MKEGRRGDHYFEWREERLECSKCGRGGSTYRCWLDAANHACDGSLHRRMLARKVGIEVTGEGPWMDPYTGHVVREGCGGWECTLCRVTLPFGVKGSRLKLGKGQRKCPQGHTKRKASNNSDPQSLYDVFLQHIGLVCD